MLPLRTETHSHVQTIVRAASGSTVAYLPRLNTPTHLAEGRVGYLTFFQSSRCAKRSSSLCRRRAIPIIHPKKRPNSAKPPATNSFPTHAFLEQAVSGYGYLDTGGNSRKIMLPRHVNGRFASVSPEHSLCRIVTALNRCRWLGRGVVGCR
jgi:hypothetical protein